MVALTLTTLLVSLAFPVVNGYVRMATAVGGDVVLGAGNLTQGGKVGLYTVLLQVGRHAVSNEILGGCSLDKLNSGTL